MTIKTEPTVSSLPAALFLPERMAIDTASSTATLLSDALSSADHDLVCDASAVGYISTPGIQLLVATSQELTQRGHRLCVSGASCAMADAFADMNLSDLLKQWSS